MFIVTEYAALMRYLIVSRKKRIHYLFGGGIKKDVPHKQASSGQMVILWMDLLVPSLHLYGPR